MLALVLLFAAASAADEPPGTADDRQGPVAGPPATAAEETSRWRRLGEDVVADYGSFYSARRLGRLGLYLGTGALLANTDADLEARDWYLEQVQSSGADDLAGAAGSFGDSGYVLPAVLAGALAAELAAGDGGERPAPATWLRRTARAYAVGTPAMLYLQRLTGGRRPGDPEGSGWRPLGEGENGVSGHAFTGAVPFLTLARMSDRRWVKVLAIGASTLPGWSRLHDDKHFLSQLLLGWLLAWESTGAVGETDAEATGGVALMPILVPEGGGVLVSWSF